jgi:hypothetical protein
VRRPQPVLGVVGVIPFFVVDQVSVVIGEPWGRRELFVARFFGQPRAVGCVAVEFLRRPIPTGEERQDNSPLKVGNQPGADCSASARIRACHD